MAKYTVAFIPPAGLPTTFHDIEADSAGDATEHAVLGFEGLGYDVSRVNVEVTEQRIDGGEHEEDEPCDCCCCTGECMDY